jgi:hypothetical protein
MLDTFARYLNSLILRLHSGSAGSTTSQLPRLLVGPAGSSTSQLPSSLVGPAGCQLPSRFNNQPTPFLVGPVDCRFNNQPVPFLVDQPIPGSTTSRLSSSCGISRFINQPAPFLVGLADSRFNNQPAPSLVGPAGSSTSQLPLFNQLVQQSASSLS